MVLKSLGSLCPVPTQTVICLAWLSATSVMILESSLSIYTPKGASLANISRYLLYFFVLNDLCVQSDNTFANFSINSFHILSCNTTRLTYLKFQFHLIHLLVQNPQWFSQHSKWEFLNPDCKSNLLGQLGGRGVGNQTLAPNTRLEFNGLGPGHWGISPPPISPRCLTPSQHLTTDIQGVFCSTYSFPLSSKSSRLVHFPP